jgi:hypothetical protein
MNITFGVALIMSTLCQVGAHNTAVHWSALH